MNKNGNRDSLDQAYKELGRLRGNSTFEELVSHAVELVKHPEPPTNLREIAAFAKKLKKTAEEIKKLHRVFVPENEFFDLPQTLSNYAQHLEQVCKTLRENRESRPREMAQCLQSLRFLVLNETGKERPAALGKLLTAKLDATTANDPEPPSYDFEAALKMNASRHPLQK